MSSSRRPSSRSRSKNSTAPPRWWRAVSPPTSCSTSAGKPSTGRKPRSSPPRISSASPNAALDAATHDVELYKVNIADNTLVAPREGRIQYRIANVGEVLPAGGRVYAMLDTSFVYMDIYLATEEAGQVKIGADARIVLDARPDIAIPAKVAFIAAQAQFTPKIVETKEDRDMLMFRIRVRVDPERLRGRSRGDQRRSHGKRLYTVNPATAWPPRLQTNVAK